jgi:hypothetical protein
MRHWWIPGPAAISGDFTWARSGATHFLRERLRTICFWSRFHYPRKMITWKVCNRRNCDELIGTAVPINRRVLASFVVRETTMDRDGVGDFCASSGKIETWTAQQADPADCTSLTIWYFRPDDVIERCMPEIESRSSPTLGRSRRRAHRCLRFASSYYAFHVCLRCTRADRDQLRRSTFRVS